MYCVWCITCYVLRIMCCEMRNYYYVLCHKFCVLCIPYDVLYVLYFSMCCRYVPLLTTCCTFLIECGWLENDHPHSNHVRWLPSYDSTRYLKTNFRAHQPAMYRRSWFDHRLMVAIGPGTVEAQVGIKRCVQRWSTISEQSENSCALPSFDTSWWEPGQKSQLPYLCGKGTAGKPAMYLTFPRPK